MAVFFLLVGVEIKREVVHGDLRDLRSVALPIIAALGGMVVPAAIFVAFNAGGAGSDGWGIPMATDIAFAVGVVTLLGKRVPLPAKIFLLTLAVADDIGAIVVIAVFYTGALGLRLARRRPRRPRRDLPHAAQRRAVPRALPRRRRVHLAGAARVRRARHPGRRRPRPAHPGVAAAVAAALPGGDPHGCSTRSTRPTTTGCSPTTSSRRTSSTSPRSPDWRCTRPARSSGLQSGLTPWVGFVIVPVFALANAGVQFSGDAVSGLFTDPVVLGVSRSASWSARRWACSPASVLAVKLGLGKLPAGATWRHVFGLAICAGVGFTVALFVTSISFTDPALADSAKIGILIGSAIAGTVGYLFLRAIPAAEPAPAEEPETEAAPTTRWTVRPAGVGA